MKTKQLDFTQWIKIVTKHGKNNPRSYGEVIKICDYNGRKAAFYTDGFYIVIYHGNDIPLENGVYDFSLKPSQVKYPNTDSVIPKDYEHYQELSYLLRFPIKTKDKDGAMLGIDHDGRLAFTHKLKSQYLNGDTVNVPLFSVSKIELAQSFGCIELVHFKEIYKADCERVTVYFVGWMI